MKNSKQESVTPHLSSLTTVKAAPLTDAPPRFQSVTHPTSVSLSQPEREALKAAAAVLHMSTSALIRQAIQQKLAQSQAALGSPPQNSSAGGTGRTGMLPALVDLANVLTTLGYVVCQLEMRLTRLRRAHARNLLSCAMQDLQLLTRRLGC